MEYIVAGVFLLIAGWAGWSGYDREAKSWDMKRAVVALSATVAAVIAALTTVQQWLSMLPH
jgi:cytochrome b subunit of formate dehydrogenase